MFKLNIQSNQSKTIHIYCFPNLTHHSEFNITKISVTHSLHFDAISFQENSISSRPLELFYF